MYKQLAIYFYSVKALLFVMFTAGMLMASSAVVAAAGANTVLDPNAHPALPTYESEFTDSSNAVTAGMASLSMNVQRMGVVMGRGIYQGSRTVTNGTASAGRSMAQAAAAAATGTRSATVFVAGKVGGGIGFVFGIPGKAVASVTRTQPVNSFIRPADSIDAPVINSQTSAELMTQFNEQQRQQFAKLLAEQTTANEKLGGQAQTGDQHHGGYPAKWDNARQDSKLDDWGMYNRECVSYTAWKVYQTYGHMPYWGGIGNANEWVRNARNAGIPTSKTPKVGSVAISMAGYYGHAMWVEKVEGSRIYVSQYNYDLRGHYSEMWLDGSNLTYIYFQ